MTQCLESPTQAPALQLEALNQRFEGAHPREILAWCLDQFPTGLVQTTAFSINGMVIIDLLYRELQVGTKVPVLFLDTLHHFPETLELVRKAQQLYGFDLKVYQARHAASQEEFADRYGEQLWETNVEQFYQLTKVEPLERGLAELAASAWITGRRRDQSRTRSHIPIFESDKHHRLKVNPLAAWSRKDSWAYIAEHGVLYNPLYDQGYASIGDQPMTTPVAAGEAERAGRWRGSDKTECGIHI
jgi:phosphoadenosine phosphosulfate reductase